MPMLKVRQLQLTLVSDVVKRRSDATRCYDKVIVLGHALCSFSNLVWIIGNDFDAFKLEAEVEAEASKVVAVGVFCL